MISHELDFNAVRNTYLMVLSTITIGSYWRKQAVVEEGDNWWSRTSSKISEVMACNHRKHKQHIKRGYDHSNSLDCDFYAMSWIHLCSMTTFNRCIWSICPEFIVIHPDNAIRLKHSFWNQYRQLLSTHRVLKSTKFAYPSISYSEGEEWMADGISYHQ